MRISDWSSDVCSSDLGSAVVGLPRNDGHIHCYYEGGVSFETIFADRLSSACGRLSEMAPTTAFVFVKEDDLQRVGTVKWDAFLTAWDIDTVGAIDLFTDCTGNVPERGGTRENGREALWARGRQSV